MLGQLLALADHLLQLLSPLERRLQIGKLQLPLTDYIIYAIKRDPTIISDNATTAVTIRQTGQYP